MALLDRLRTAFKSGASARAPVSGALFSPWSVPYAAARPTYAQSARRAFCDNPVAQRAVKIVAEALGTVPLKTAHDDVRRLITARSAGQPLLETLAAQMLLHGNAYVQILRNAEAQPVELFALRPERVSVVPDADGWPRAYRYRAGDSALDLALENAEGWPDIVPIRSFHPVDDHYGAGGLDAAEQSVAIHNAAARWNLSLLENAARPSGALVHEQSDHAPMSAAQMDQLRQELTALFQGGENAGRPMVLEGGLRWQPISLSPADMDFATLKSAAARDIALAFGVPPMLLGLPGDNTYANYREANRALWRLTILPLADKILAALTQALEGQFADLELMVDLDRIPALSEDREKLWAQVSGADFLSASEKRSLLGLADKGQSIRDQPIRGQTIKGARP